MNEQPLDLKGFFTALRRRRLVVIVLLVLGVSAGAAYAVMLPPLPSASALVIVGPSQTASNSATPAVDISTQSIIATSTSVLAAAGTAVTPSISASDLLHQVSVSAASNEVLQIKVSAKTQADALALANAVATNYIVDVTRLSSSSGALLADLQSQSAQLTHQILMLQNKIEAVSSRLAQEPGRSSAGQSDANELATLRTEQDDDSQQLNSVSSQILSAESSANLSSGAPQMLQKAQPVRVSQLRLPIDVLAGAGLGLFLGCIIAVHSARKDRRLWLRDAIATVIGVPVVASVRAERCRSTEDWKRLLDGYQLSPVDSWSVRRLVNRVTKADPSPLPRINVVAFARDGAALTAAVMLAEGAVALGTHVTMVPGDHHALVALRAACATRAASSTDAVQSWGRPAPDRAGPDLLGTFLEVSIVAVDEAPLILAPAHSCFLAVSAGFATSEALARVALAASDLGSPVEGVVVVNPSDDDHTTGSFFEPEEVQVLRNPGALPGAFTGRALR